MLGLLSLRKLSKHQETSGLHLRNPLSPYSSEYENPNSCAS